MLANILAVGLMASVMSFSPRYVVDNQNDTITFSADELNNNTYNNLSHELNNFTDNEIEEIVSDTTLSYNNLTYTYEEVAEGFINYRNDSTNIYFNFNDEPMAKWQYSDTEGTPQPFTASMTINNAEWFIANIEEPPSLTLSKYDLNNKKYTYLAEQLNNTANLDLSNTSITYNGETLDFSELIANDSLSYEYHLNYVIMLQLDNESDDYGKWQLLTYENNDLVATPFTVSITINNAQWFLDNINAPLDSGDMMTAITSGLPLMASLAQAFLNGFTSIFWNSTTSSLTTFSMFALIMLSVAIVFACIKLVLNVVRSNTGV